MLKKILVAGLFYAVTIQSNGQIFQVLEPTSSGRTLDFSEDFINKFNSKGSLIECENVNKKVSAEGRDWKQLTESEKEVIKYCDQIKEDVWDIVGSGCSWYCGGGLGTLTASSELKPTKDINYIARNAHDLSYKTAWVEGVQGYGIGQYLEYHFPPDNPRITKIIVVNGYVKSDKAWRENTRVKQLKLYLDNKEFAILNLKDTKQEQIFAFDPIGNGNRTDSKKLKSKPWWTLKFEIMDVYQGDKFDDTAITEIYFDGIDVH